MRFIDAFNQAQAGSDTFAMRFYVIHDPLSELPEPDKYFAVDKAGRLAAGPAARVVVTFHPFTKSGRVWSSNAALVDPNTPSQRRFDR